MHVHVHAKKKHKKKSRRRGGDRRKGANLCMDVDIVALPPRERRRKRKKEENTGLTTIPLNDNNDKDTQNQHAINRSNEKLAQIYEEGLYLLNEEADGNTVLKSEEEATVTPKSATPTSSSLPFPRTLKFECESV